MTEMKRGLGIGTAACALIRHHVETEVVELDPLVYHFARHHFDMPEPKKVYMTSAESFIKVAQKEALRYDYILHDLFSGGWVSDTELAASNWAVIHGIMTENGVLAVVWVFSRSKFAFSSH